MTDARLIHLPYSPWSEKARWALDLRGVEVQRQTYQPVIGEPMLRRIRGDGKASVPVLVLPERAIGDSFEIARWACAQGSGPDLVPAGSESEIERWNALAERGLAAGRVRGLGRVLEDSPALMDLVPRPLRWLGPVATAVAAFGVRRTLRKYGSEGVAAEVAKVELLAVLEEIRAALSKATPAENGVRYLLGRLTLADVAVAQVLAFVEPPSSGLRIGKATRRVWTDQEIGATCKDLLEWRNALYAAHRGEPPPA